MIDKKWENRDIIDVEQANSTKFSKLDEIGIPLRFFEAFSDVLVDRVVAPSCKRQ